MDKVPGAREYAIPFYSIEDSYRIKQAIIKLKVEIKPILFFALRGRSSEDLSSKPLGY